MGLSFSNQSKQEIEGVLDKYPTKEAAILPALYIAQKEFGYVSLEAMECVAEEIGVTPARIYGVATFYTMYNKKKVGKNLVQVCCNISRAMNGADEVFSYISKKLGIKNGETTSDEKFTLMKVECLGACGNAPMMQINDDYFENLTPESVDEVLDKLARE
jgi:NADH-quinone oxidoreductase subunit E